MDGPVSAPCLIVTTGHRFHRYRRRKPISAIEVAATFVRGLFLDDDQVLCKRDGAHIVVQVRQRRLPIRELPVDGMGNLLHVLDKRGLAFQRVAVDLGPGRPVALLNVLDDEQATGNDTWPESLKCDALVVWHMGAVVDDDIKTPPGVLKKCAQESDVRLVAAVQIAPGVEVNSTVARTACSVGCRLLSCMALGLEARLPVITCAVAE